nr:unnamed protein product [Naegleria fowleri]
MKHKKLLFDSIRSVHHHVHGHSLAVLMNDSVRIGSFGQQHSTLHKSTIPNLPFHQRHYSKRLNGDDKEQQQHQQQQQPPLLYHPISEGFFEWSKQSEVGMTHNSRISSNEMNPTHASLHLETQPSTTHSDSLQLILLANASYPQSLALQTYLFERLKSQKSESHSPVLNHPKTPHFPSHYLIATEHVESCFTIGKLRFDETFSQRHFIKNERGLNIYKIGRGGGITFHCPGQIVLYPIFDLESRVLMRNVKWFSDEFMLRKFALPLLQEFVNNVCGDSRHTQSSISLHVGGESEMGIYSELVKNSRGFDNENSHHETHFQVDQHRSLNGIPKTKRKLASIGLQLSRWCTMHGIAINLDLNETDLRSFREDIVACGLQHVVMTSLANEMDRRGRYETQDDTSVVGTPDGLNQSFSFSAQHYKKLLNLLLKQLNNCQFKVDDILLVDGLQISNSRWLLKPEIGSDPAKDELMHFIRTEMTN